MSKSRFYKAAAVVAVDGGWGIELDGRGVRTPSGALQVAPVRSLAEAMAEEWNEQGDTVKPASMPLCGLTNAAIDRVSVHRDTFLQQIEDYSKFDLICYGAEHPADLVKRQHDIWQPLMDWMGERFDAKFKSTSGIGHIAQPERAVAAVRHHFETLDDFKLAGCVDLATTLGSVIIALALFEGQITVNQAFSAAFLDELYQVETWGDDSDAQARRKGLRLDIDATVRFLELLNAEIS